MSVRGGDDQVKPPRQNLVCVGTKVLNIGGILSMSAVSREPTSKPRVGQGAEESWKTSRTVLVSWYGGDLASCGINVRFHRALV